jgi:hypothetical protein
MAMNERASPNELRDQEIFTKRMNGASLAVLAEEYGVVPSRICTIVSEMARKLPEMDRSALTALTIDTLMNLRGKVMNLAEMQGAPVTAGQRGDVLIDPETEEVVRDYSLRLNAVKTMLALDAQFAKRLGLDAPAESVVRATVQYEIVGVDPEDLT